MAHILKNKYYYLFSSILNCYYENYISCRCIVAVIGCTSVKEIQVEMVQAELIKIDTLFRQQNTIKQFTWRDQDNIDYISFAAMDQTYPLGISLTVMRTR